VHTSSTQRDKQRVPGFRPTPPVSRPGGEHTTGRRLLADGGLSGEGGTTPCFPTAMRTRWRKKEGQRRSQSAAKRHADERRRGTAASSQLPATMGLSKVRTSTAGSRRPGAREKRNKGGGERTVDEDQELTGAPAMAGRQLASSAFTSGGGACGRCDEVERAAVARRS
jgi:hypothetical protein